MAFFRALVRRPGFAFGGGLLLALCSGLSISFLAAARAVAWNPLPFRLSGELFLARETFQGGSLGGVSFGSWSAWHEGLANRAPTAAFRSREAGLETDQPERIGLTQTTCEYFETIGAALREGRWFNESDCAADATPVAVVSERLARRHSGNLAPGTTLRIDGEIRQIIGVVQDTAPYPALGWFDVWTPFDPRSEAASPRARRLSMLVRLEEWNAPAIESRLRSIQDSLSRLSPETHRGYSAVLVSARDASVGSYSTWTALLALAGVLLFAVSAVNLAGLQIDHAARRGGDIAIRLALGASARRILFGALAELAALLPIAFGGGVIAAMALTQVLRTVAAPYLPRVDEIRVGWMEWTYGAGILAATALGLAGTAVWVSRRTDIAAALKSQGTRAAGGSARLRAALAGIQVTAFATAAVAAFAISEGTERLRRSDPGFRAERVLTFAIVLPAARYPSFREKSLFYRRALEELAALPGVERAGGIQSLPLLDPQGSWMLLPEGQPEPRAGDERFVHTKIVSPGLFASLGIPIVAGRGFNEAEAWENRDVMMVNRAAASALWPGQDAVGKRVRMDRGGPWFTITGVTGDIRQRGLDVSPAPECYRPYSTYARSPALGQRTNFVLRVGGSPSSYATAVRSAMARLDPALPLIELTPLSARLERLYGFEELLSRVLSFVAILTAVLALLGLMGAIGGVLEARRRELALRMAVGATAGRAALEVTRGPFAAALVGFAAGLAAGYCISFFVPGATISMGSALGSGCGVAVLLAGGFLQALRWAKSVNLNRTLMEPSG